MATDEINELRQVLHEYLALAEASELLQVARQLVDGETPPVPRTGYYRWLQQRLTEAGIHAKPPAAPVELLEALCRELVTVERILQWSEGKSNRAEAASIRNHRKLCTDLRGALMGHVRPLWMFAQEDSRT
jgi:hypothetical protein